MKLLRHVDKDNCYAICNFKDQRPGVGVPEEQVAEHCVGLPGYVVDIIIGRLYLGLDELSDITIASQ